MHNELFEMLLWTAGVHSIPFFAYVSFADFIPVGLLMQIEAKYSSNYPAFFAPSVNISPSQLNYNLSPHTHTTLSPIPASPLVVFDSATVTSWMLSFCLPLSNW